MTKTKEPMKPALVLRRLRRTAAERPLTQVEVAKALSLDRKHLGNLESDPKLSRTIEIFIRLARFYCCQVEDLVSRELLDELTADVAARCVDQGLKIRPLDQPPANLGWGDDSLDL